ANVAGFSLPDVALAFDLVPDDLIDDDDLQLIGGYLNGDPVACAMAIRSRNVVGVYAVGTAERARRRGIGTAITWAAIEQGRRWGCDVAVLQASEMGLPVYSAMGFRRVTAYVNFGPRPGAVAG